MRFPAALLFCFSFCLLWTSCDDDDDIGDQIFIIDCEKIITSDTSICTPLNRGDSVAFVNSFLGSWYLAASQNSGFGGGNTECINYSNSESPYRFTFNSDYTWQLTDTENSIDTTLGWTAILGFAGWGILSTSNGLLSPPAFSHLCDDNLASDSRPRDGALRVYARVE